MRLNLGCGRNVKRGWVNVDLYRKVPGVEHIDLRSRWPWNDGCAQEVYAEHFLEHLDRVTGRDEALHFAREAWRVLGKGGKITVGVPDARWALLWYWNGGEGAEFQAEVDRWHPKWVRTKLDHVQWSWRMNGAHKWAYDAESLSSLLGRAGFRNIRERPFDPGMDSVVRRVGTLYMEGVRCS